MLEHLQIIFLLDTLNKITQDLEKVVTNYGDIKTTQDVRTDESVRHDYLFFCLSKSLRSIKASHLLIKENYYEDTFTLVRSVYEVYLHMSYVQNYPDKIHKVVASKLGVYFDIFEHPLRKDGKPLKHKAVDQTTGKEYLINLSLLELSQNTRFKSDEDIYPLLYSYLSEYAHVHMISIGSYQSQQKKKFTLDSDPGTKLFQTTLMTLFTSWLILNEVSLFEFSKKDKKRITKQLFDSGILLFNYIGGLEFQGKLTDLQENILKRINDVLGLDTNV